LNPTGYGVPENDYEFYNNEEVLAHWGLLRHGKNLSTRPQLSASLHFAIQYFYV
jgi:hypothetical protein